MPSNTNVLDPGASLLLVPSSSTLNVNGSLPTDPTPQFLSGSSSVASTEIVTYLSDLNSTSATNGWGVFEKDKSNGEQGATDGKTLTLNGVTYAKGLGVHAGSEIIYNLGGKYTKFSSNIGVDDEVGNAGSVVFQVFVDGIQLFTSSKMTGATATQLVNLDVTGKQSLKLIVTNGGDDNTFDHADWADAKLLSGGTPFDTTAPTATLAAAALNSTRTTPYGFTVTYADATAVNLSTINGTTAASDIRVTGAHGFSQLATLVGVSTPNVNSSSLTATYQIVAPDGVWDANDNSTYTATLIAGQVADTLGNTTAANINLGTFQVAVPTGSSTETVTYLSDLNSTSAANGWGVFEKDKSNGEQGATDGKTLTLNGVTYAKGLGVHAGSEIIYNLGGKYTKFSSNIGVDDEVGNAGSVVFQVFVDGIQLFTSSKMTGATATQLVNLDVTGKQSLKLIVTNGGDDNTFDHADWADAKLISGGIPPTPPISLPAPSPLPTETRSQIGTNLAGLADWSTEIPFVDMFKTSREWISQRQGAKWGEGGKLNLTSEGWIASLDPGQFAETVVMTGKTFPGGRYTLLYDGEGKLDFTFSNAKIISQSPGKMTVDVTPDDVGIFIRLSETNPSNPVRNIRFIMPGFENTYQTQPFNPVFLERLAKFDTLRFMDWEATNNSTLTNWSDRSTTASATQATSKGVALEYMIQLANTLKIDPWFTLPAQASDDYVQKFATMVRDRLDPSLKAHVEYTNEAWNGIFAQANYVGQQGLARGLDNTSWGAGLRYYSERSVEIFKIWENVFGASTSQRVERVLSGQAANPWVGEQILGWKDAYKHADAYAIAPYFDGFDADGDGSSDINDVARVNITINMTADQIIDGMLKEIPTEIKAMFDSNANIAKRFGIDLASYEGGGHLTSYQFPDDKVARMTDLFTEVNRNPRMRDVYKAYLDQWQASSGGGDFNQFNDVASSSKWGFWGALEYQNQDPNTAPKYLGIMDFINAES
ncbi:NPCBM/NEW2 domain-containing protein [Phormidium sp. CLA17]|uniref:NPCBM/NEW2 domain-containing protein n=1 Tax=Leptolyngbya sp. Cla-17 TaxID=2803751 RepID=UPI0018D9DEEF|nr:NPCBM/NEW2 domain-containing protein [Leptolyngbya sp. Cla-17]MBM0743681.1 NPCBM/NEW2 domain-containing protein [Leptolyngbya sp. Cla-17]